MGAKQEIIELGQRFGPGMPYLPQPPFEYGMTLLHAEGDVPGQMPGSTEAVDRLATGLHIGTHVDSLSHIALHGRLFDGTDLFEDGVQDPESGLRMRSGRGMWPILAPAVLLDFPRYLGREIVEDGHAITVDEMLGCADAAGVEIEAGIVVLMRMGFDVLWDSDPERFLSPSIFPGPEIEVARLLRQRGVVAAGSDTPPFERYPAEEALTVHVELLVRGGIPIIECLRLSELAEREVTRFQFVALPLNMPHATGSPINPVAIVGSGGEMPA